MEKLEMVKVEIWASSLSFQTEHVETRVTSSVLQGKTPRGVGTLFEAAR